jgi:hypothetical protein
MRNVAAMAGRAPLFSHAARGLVLLQRGHPFRIAAAFVLAGSVIGWTLHFDAADNCVLVIAIGLALGPEALNAAVRAAACNEPRIGTRGLPFVGVLISLLGTLVLSLFMYVPAAIMSLAASW